MTSELEAKLQTQFEHLVPPMGPTETLEGEFVRAINRILYRYYNDGDYWWTGYGCETVGPPVAFLKHYSDPLKNPDSPLPESVIDGLMLSDGLLGDAYIAHIKDAAWGIVDYVEEKAKGSLTPNDVDMWDWESEYDDMEELEDY